MPDTLGIHWIVTTYGSWLHGDPRGSWQNGRLIGPDPFLEESIQQRMTHETVVLNSAEIIQVSVEWGRGIAEWGLCVHAATIKPTHAHVVFAPMTRDVNEVIAGLKRRSAASVLKVRRTMHGEAPAHLWTARPWPVFIYTQSRLINAVEYVRDHNRRAGRPADPYDWITPLET